MTQNRTQTSKKKTREFNPPAMIAWARERQGQGSERLLDAHRRRLELQGRRGLARSISTLLPERIGGRIVLMPPKAKDEAQGEGPETEAGDDHEGEE